MYRKKYHVYIITNKNNTVLYTGVTSEISNRVWQHKEKRDKKSFSAKYNTDKIVYLEEYNDISEAISREKQIKAGSRKNKIKLIESINVSWKDLLENK